MWLRTSTSTRSIRADEADLVGVGDRLDLEQRPVLPRQPDRGLAGAVEPLDDFGVELADQDHLRHLDRLRVGDPQALVEPDLEPEPLHVAGDLGAAAVDDDRVEADVLEQDDVGGEGVAQLLVEHRRAAVLDHHRAAVELADVGQRLEQRLDARCRRRATAGPARSSATAPLARVAHQVVYSRVDPHVLVAEVGEPDVGGAPPRPSRRPISASSVSPPSSAASIESAPISSRSSPGQRGAGGLGDPAPVGVAAEERRLDQRRVGDRAGDPLGLGGAGRLADLDPADPGGALAVADDLDRQLHEDRLQQAAAAAACRRRRSPAAGRMSLVLIWPSTVIRLKEASTARAQRGGGVGDDGVGLDEAEHRRHVRLDHPGPLRLGGEGDAAGAQRAALRPAVGGHDRLREGAAALRGEAGGGLVDPGQHGARSASARRSRRSRRRRPARGLEAERGGGALAHRQRVGEALLAGLGVGVAGVDDGGADVGRGR